VYIKWLNIYNKWLSPITTYSNDLDLGTMTDVVLLQKNDLELGTLTWDQEKYLSKCIEWLIDEHK
jgi:hypothetical protein